MYIPKTPTSYSFSLSSLKRDCVCSSVYPVKVDTNEFVIPSVVVRLREQGPGVYAGLEAPDRWRRWKTNTGYSNLITEGFIYSLMS